MENAARATFVGHEAPTGREALATEQPDHPDAAQGKRVAMTVGPDNDADQLSIVCSASDADVLQLAFHSVYAKPHIEQCESVRIGSALSSPGWGTGGDIGFVFNMANTKDIEKLAISNVKVPMIIEDIPQTAELTVSATTSSSVLLFADTAGKNDHARIVFAGRNGKMDVDEVEHLHVTSGRWSNVILSANVLESLAVKGEGITTMIPFSFGVELLMANSAGRANNALIINGEAALGSDLISIAPTDETIANLVSIDASEVTGIFFLAMREAQPLRITGGAGEDVIYLVGGQKNWVSTGAGDDEISLNRGDDVIDAGAGNDLIIPGAGANLVTTGPGRDVVAFSAGRLSAPPSDQNAITTVSDFDPVAGDRIQFRFLPGGTVADAETQGRVQVAIDSVAPGASVRALLDAACAETETDAASWFHREGDTYAFVDHAPFKIVRLTGMLDLTGDNIFFSS